MNDFTRISIPRPTRTSHETSAVDLRRDVVALLDGGYRLALVAAHDDVTSIRIVYTFTRGAPDQRTELVLCLDPKRPEMPTLADVSFPASRFEREMRDLFGVEPLGHPQPRRLVMHQHWPEGWYPMRHDAGPMPRMVEDASAYPFIPIEGPGVYEIPVGPVHAGLIEPGHFRLFVVGETILRMKARLWFVHKGIERLMQGSSVAGAMQIAQRISGDTAVGHGTAFMMAVEEALELDVSPHDRALRGVLLELERLYNHVADLGALCNDVAFSIANSRALTVREQLLRLNEQVTGHRLLRDGVVLGGARVRRLPTVEELDRIESEVEEINAMALNNSLVLDRFVGTAVLGHDDAVAMGALGVVARASGCDFDARVAHPSTAMPVEFNVPTLQSGDVAGRFEIRVQETRIAIACVRAWVNALDSKITLPAEPTSMVQSAGLRSGLGIVEAWRGTVVHRIELDREGALARVKIVDPSFFNWPALPISLVDTIVPDFPLANKSFNLSYAGNDL